MKTTKPKVARMPQPMQPIGYDDRGVVRFKPNAIVQYLVDEFRHGERPQIINTIAYEQAQGRFTKEDYEQFNQLMGYSVCGFCEFDVDKHRAKVKDAAWDAMQALLEVGK